MAFGLQAKVPYPLDFIADLSVWFYTEATGIYLNRSYLLTDSKAKICLVYFSFGLR